MERSSKRSKSRKSSHAAQGEPAVRRRSSSSSSSSSQNGVGTTSRSAATLFIRVDPPSSSQLLRSVSDSPSSPTKYPGEAAQINSARRSKRRRNSLVLSLRPRLRRPARSLSSPPPAASASPVHGRHNRNVRRRASSVDSWTSSQHSAKLYNQEAHAHGTSMWDWLRQHGLGQYNAASLKAGFDQFALLHELDRLDVERWAAMVAMSPSDRFRLLCAWADANGKPLSAKVSDWLAAAVPGLPAFACDAAPVTDVASLHLLSQQQLKQWVQSAGPEHGPVLSQALEKEAAERAAKARAMTAWLRQLGLAQYADASLRERFDNVDKIANMDEEQVLVWSRAAEMRPGHTVLLVVAWQREVLRRYGRLDQNREQRALEAKALSHSNLSDEIATAQMSSWLSEQTGLSEAQVAASVELGFDRQSLLSCLSMHGERCEVVMDWAKAIGLTDQQAGQLAAACLKWTLQHSGQDEIAHTRLAQLHSQRKQQHKQDSNSSPDKQKKGLSLWLAEAGLSKHRAQWRELQEREEAPATLAELGRWSEQRIRALAGGEWGLDLPPANQARLIAAWREQHLLSTELECELDVLADSPGRPQAQSLGAWEMRHWLEARGLGRFVQPSLENGHSNVAKLGLLSPQEAKNWARVVQMEDREEALLVAQCQEAKATRARSTSALAQRLLADSLASSSSPSQSPSVLAARNSSSSPSLDLPSPAAFYDSPTQPPSQGEKNTSAVKGSEQKTEAQMGSVSSRSSSRSSSRAESHAGNNAAKGRQQKTTERRGSVSSQGSSTAAKPSRQKTQASASFTGFSAAKGREAKTEQRGSASSQSSAEAKGRSAVSGQGSRRGSVASSRGSGTSGKKAEGQAASSSRRVSDASQNMTHAVAAANALATHAKRVEDGSVASEGSNGSNCTNGGNAHRARRNSVDMVSIASSSSAYPSSRSRRQGSLPGKATSDMNAWLKAAGLEMYLVASVHAGYKDPKAVLQMSREEVKAWAAKVQMKSWHANKLLLAWQSSQSPSKEREENEVREWLQARGIPITYAGSFLRHGLNPVSQLYQLDEKDVQAVAKAVKLKPRHTAILLGEWHKQVGPEAGMYTWMDSNGLIQYAAVSIEHGYNSKTVTPAGLKALRREHLEEWASKIGLSPSPSVSAAIPAASAESHLALTHPMPLKDKARLITAWKREARREELEAGCQDFLAKHGLEFYGARSIATRKEDKVPWTDEEGLVGLREDEVKTWATAVGMAASERAILFTVWRYSLDPAAARLAGMKRFLGDAQLGKHLQASLALGHKDVDFVAEMEEEEVVAWANELKLPHWEKARLVTAWKRVAEPRASRREVQMDNWLKAHGLGLYHKACIELRYNKPALVPTFCQRRVTAWASAVRMNAQHRELLLAAWENVRCEPSEQRMLWLRAAELGEYAAASAKLGDRIVPPSPEFVPHWTKAQVQVWASEIGMSSRSARRLQCAWFQERVAVVRHWLAGEGLSSWSESSAALGYWDPTTIAELKESQVNSWAKKLELMKGWQQKALLKLWWHTRQEKGKEGVKAWLTAHRLGQYADSWNGEDEIGALAELAEQEVEDWTREVFMPPSDADLMLQAWRSLAEAHEWERQRAQGGDDQSPEQRFAGCGWSGLPIVGAEHLFLRRHRSSSPSRSVSRSSSHSPSRSRSPVRLASPVRNPQRAPSPRRFRVAERPARAESEARPRGRSESEARPARDKNKAKSPADAPVLPPMVFRRTPTPEKLSVVALGGPAGYHGWGYRQNAESREVIKSQETWDGTRARTPPPGFGMAKPSSINRWRPSTPPRQPSRRVFAFDEERERRRAERLATGRRPPLRRKPSDRLRSARSNPSKQYAQSAFRAAAAEANRKRAFKSNAPRAVPTSNQRRDRAAATAAVAAAAGTAVVFSPREEAEEEDLNFTPARNGPSSPEQADQFHEEEEEQQEQVEEEEENEKDEETQAMQMWLSSKRLEKYVQASIENGYRNRDAIKHMKKSEVLEWAKKTDMTPAARSQLVRAWREEQRSAGLGPLATENKGKERWADLASAIRAMEECLARAQLSHHAQASVEQGYEDPAAIQYYTESEVRSWARQTGMTSGESQRLLALWREESGAQLHGLRSLHEWLAQRDWGKDYAKGQLPAQLPQDGQFEELQRWADGAKMKPGHRLQFELAWLRLWSGVEGEDAVEGSAHIDLALATDDTKHSMASWLAVHDLTDLIKPSLDAGYKDARLVRYMTEQDLACWAGALGPAGKGGKHLKLSLAWREEARPSWTPRQWLCLEVVTARLQDKDLDESAAAAGQSSGRGPEDWAALERLARAVEQQGEALDSVEKLAGLAQTELVERAEQAGLSQHTTKELLALQQREQAALGLGKYAALHRWLKEAGQLQYATYASVQAGYDDVFLPGRLDAAQAAEWTHQVLALHPADANKLQTACAIDRAARAHGSLATWLHNLHLLPPPVEDAYRNKKAEFLKTQAHYNPANLNATLRTFPVSRSSSKQVTPAKAWQGAPFETSFRNLLEENIDRSPSQSPGKKSRKKRRSKTEGGSSVDGAGAMGERQAQRVAANLFAEQVPAALTVTSSPSHSQLSLAEGPAEATGQVGRERSEEEEMSLELARSARLLRRRSSSIGRDRAREEEAAAAAKIVAAAAAAGTPLQSADEAAEAAIAEARAEAQAEAEAEAEAEGEDAQADQQPSADDDEMDDEEEEEEEEEEEHKEQKEEEEGEEETADEMIVRSGKLESTHELALLPSQAHVLYWTRKVGLTEASQVSAAVEAWTAEQDRIHHRPPLAKLPVPAWLRQLGLQQACGAAFQHVQRAQVPIATTQEHTDPLRPVPGGFASPGLLAGSGGEPLVQDVSRSWLESCAIAAQLPSGTKAKLVAEWRMSRSVGLAEWLARSTAPPLRQYAENTVEQGLFPAAAAGDGQETEAAVANMSRNEVTRWAAGVHMPAEHAELLLAAWEKLQHGRKSTSPQQEQAALLAQQMLAEARRREEEEMARNSLAEEAAAAALAAAASGKLTEQEAVRLSEEEEKQQAEEKEKRRRQEEEEKRRAAEEKERRRLEEEEERRRLDEEEERRREEEDAEELRKWEERKKMEQQLAAERRRTLELEAQTSPMGKWLGAIGLGQYTVASIAGGYDEPALVPHMLQEEVAEWAEEVGMKGGHKAKLMHAWRRENNVLENLPEQEEEDEDEDEGELESLAEWLARCGLEQYAAASSLHLGRQDALLLSTLTVLELEHWADVLGMSSEERERLRRAWRAGHDPSLPAWMEARDLGQYIKPTAALSALPHPQETEQVLGLREEQVRQWGQHAGMAPAHAELLLAHWQRLQQLLQEAATKQARGRGNVAGTEGTLSNWLEKEGLGRWSLASTAAGYEGDPAMLAWMDETQLEEWAQVVQMNEQEAQQLKEAWHRAVGPGSAVAGNMTAWLSNRGLGEYAEASEKAGYNDARKVPLYTEAEVHQWAAVTGMRPGHAARLLAEWRRAVVTSPSRAAIGMAQWLSARGLSQYSQASVALGYDDPSLVGLLSEEQVLSWARGAKMDGPATQRLLAAWQEEASMRHWLTARGLGRYAELSVQLGYKVPARVPEMSEEEVLEWARRTEMLPGHRARLLGEWRKEREAWRQALESDYEGRAEQNDTAAGARARGARFRQVPAVRELEPWRVKFSQLLFLEQEQRWQERLRLASLQGRAWQQQQRKQRLSSKRGSRSHKPRGSSGDSGQESGGQRSAVAENGADSGEETETDDESTRRREDSEEPTTTDHERPDSSGAGASARESRHRHRRKKARVQRWREKEASKRSPGDGILPRERSIVERLAALDASGAADMDASRPSQVARFKMSPGSQRLVQYQQSQQRARAASLRAGRVDLPAPVLSAPSPFSIVTPFSAVASSFSASPSLSSPVQFPSLRPLPSSSPAQLPQPAQVAVELARPELRRRLAALCAGLEVYKLPGKGQGDVQRELIALELGRHDAPLCLTWTSRKQSGRKRGFVLSARPETKLRQGPVHAGFQRDHRKLQRLQSEEAGFTLANAFSLECPVNGEVLALVARSLSELELWVSVLSHVLQRLDRVGQAEGAEKAPQLVASALKVLLQETDKVAVAMHGSSSMPSDDSAGSVDRERTRRPETRKRVSIGQSSRMNGQQGESKHTPPAERDRQPSFVSSVDGRYGVYARAPTPQEQPNQKQLSSLPPVRQGSGGPGIVWFPAQTAPPSGMVGSSNSLISQPAGGTASLPALTTAASPSSFSPNPAAYSRQNSAHGASAVGNYTPLPRHDSSSSVHRSSLTSSSSSRPTFHSKNGNGVVVSNHSRQTSVPQPLSRPGSAKLLPQEQQGELRLYIPPTRELRADTRHFMTPEDAHRARDHSPLLPSAGHTGQTFAPDGRAPIPPSMSYNGSGLRKPLKLPPPVQGPPVFATSQFNGY